MRDEGVQGVLTLFCSGAAQVCHDDSVVELQEARGGRGRRGQTGGKGRSGKGEASQKGFAMMMTMDEDMKCAQNLSQRM